MKTYLSFLFLFFYINSFAQTDTLKLSLPEVIILAQSDAPDVLIAKTRLNNQYWQYQSFLANYKPRIDFNATLPSLNRAINSITLPDGSLAFIQQALMTNSIGVAIRQDIAATGGTIFANTGLRRIDIFKSDGNPNAVSYLSTPLSVGFQQPLFGFNRLKWDRKIQPTIYDEAQRAYSEEMEDIANEGTRLFFDLLTAQLALEAAIIEQANADTLYNISKGRFSVGKIAETELLQVELSVMTANTKYAGATLNLQTQTERLRNFLGIQEAINFRLIAPKDIPDMIIDADLALQEARKNRSEILSFQRQLVEANRDVAIAQANSGLNIDIFGTVGLSQTGGTIGEAYQKPLDQEQVTIGLQVPIADWGKAKARIEIAESNRELTQMQVAQDRISFERELLLSVQQFDLLRNQVALAVRTLEVAQKRNEITRQRYLVGKIGILELNLAIQEQDTARRNYVAALRNFWVAYYELRRLTLFDFEQGVRLIKE